MDPVAFYDLEFFREHNISGTLLSPISGASGIQVLKSPPTRGGGDSRTGPWKLDFLNCEIIKVYHLAGTSIVAPRCVSDKSMYLGSRRTPAAV